MGAGTFFYVHGSGNREDDALRNGIALRDGLGLPPGSDRLQLSRWGTTAGPDLGFPLLEQVLPQVAPGVEGEIDPAAEDAYAPLRDLVGAPGIEEPTGQSRPETDQVLALLQGGVAIPEIGVSAAAVRQAAAEIAASPEFAAAAQAPEDRLVDATLRAVVARAIELQSGPPSLDFDLGAAAGRLGDGIAAVAGKLLGVGGGIVGDVFGLDLGAAAKLALSKRLAKRRHEYTLKALPVPGDVLFYQRHGGSIRDAVRTEIAELPRPIVALGHSLGAIVLVDTLFGPDAQDQGVQELVTFGAQSSMLQVIGAIDPLQAPAIRWTNVWTRYDFISFLAGRLWPEATDVEVRIEVGFPDSHGLYYETKGFYDAIKAGPLAADILRDHA